MSDYGLCRCGCGEKTNLARTTNARIGKVKGQPNDWIKGHRNRKYQPGEPCMVKGCPKPIEAHHLCHTHFEARRRGDTLPESIGPEMTAEEAFMAKVKVLPSGHWIWQKSTASEGRYGAVQYDGRVQPAHRVAWQMFRGPIEDGIVVNHVCRKTLCCNPVHLELITQRENVLIGDAPPAHNAAKSHCKRNHEFNEENTIILKSGGRSCRACATSEEGRAAGRQRQRRYRERQRAKLAAS